VNVRARIATIALGLVLSAEGSDAASSTKWIVFAASPQHGTQPSQLFRIRTTGSGLKQITTGVRGAVSPDFSPDGTRVVFRRGLSGIFVVNVDGRGLKRLTDGRDDAYPVWSPDGRAIAFLRPTAGTPTASGFFRLLVMDANGRRQHALRLAPLPAAGRPSWLPDARSIVVSSKGALYKVRATDGKPVRRLGPTVDTNNGGPYWTLAPNGKTIALIGARPAGCEGATCKGSALYLLRFGASQGRRLADDVGEAGWSPDSRTLVFVDRGELNLQRISGDPAKVIAVGAPGANSLLGDAPPTWQP
jgi:Tol biopolymer transport system component